MKIKILFVLVVLLLSGCNSPEEVVDTIEDKPKIFFDRVSDFYDDVRFLTQVGSSIVFVAEKDKRVFVVKDGVAGLFYDGISELKRFGDGYVFVAREGDKWFVIYGKNKYGPYSATPTLLSCLENEDRLIYFDYEYDKKGTGEKRTDPTHVVFDGTDSRFLDYDNETLIPACPAEDKVDYEIIHVDGKDDEKSADFLLYKGKKYGPYFDAIAGPMKKEINGDLFYAAYTWDKKHGRNAYVFKNGEKFSGPYDNVAKIVDVGGKVAILSLGFGFFLEFDGRSVVVPGGNSVFCMLSELKNVNGKLAFIASYYDDCDTKAVYEQP